jgi:hypothetical protein
MNWAWAESLDQVWRSPAIPVWLTLVAAGFFAIIVLLTLLRAEKSVANGALTVITLLAVGIAVAATLRAFSSGDRLRPMETQSSQPVSVAMPALACIDDLAGDTVLAACEKALFSSPESAAAAVSYAASQIARLTALGDVATASPNMTTEMRALRRAIEGDHYGVMAQALLARDHCTPTECAAFRSLTDSRQIVSNLNEHFYDGLITRYVPSWNAPAAPAAPAPATVLAPSVPTGKPTNADFPSATSIPPVSIMNPEPGTTPSAASRPPASSAAASTPLPSPRPAAAATPAPPAAKKQASPKPAPTPVQLTPPPPATASVPAAANE